MQLAPGPNILFSLLLSFFGDGLWFSDGVTVKIVDVST